MKKFLILWLMAQTVTAASLSTNVTGVKLNQFTTNLSNALINGGNLTNLDASKLTGTVPLAALPSLVVTQGQGTAVTLSNALTVTGAFTSGGTVSVGSGPSITTAGLYGNAVNVRGVGGPNLNFSNPNVTIGSGANTTPTGNLICSNINLSGSLTATNGFGVLGTNTAPANVTVGTTAPDAWLWFTNGGVAFKVPAWKDH